MLKKANEPLYILRNLRKLGTLDLVAHMDGLPGLAELEPTSPIFGGPAHCKLRLRAR